MGSATAPLMLFQASSSFASSQASANALKAKGAYDFSTAQTNAEIANYQAEDALKRGDKAAANHASAVKSLVGKQRASLAAQGIDVGSGSARDIQTDTHYLGALDALTIKNNAAKEAFGYKMNAQNYASQGAFSLAAANNSANNTLLTGGLNALGYGAYGMSKFESPFKKSPSSTRVRSGGYELPF